MKSFAEIQKLAKKGNVIPLFERIPCDLDTPVLAYMKLAPKHKMSFLLESIEGGEKLARYSFLGFDPFLIIEGSENNVVLRQGSKKKILECSPLALVSELFSMYRPVKDDSLPRFTGGAVGYFAYDAIRWIEDIPDRHSGDDSLPEMFLALYDQVVVFDHIKQEMLVIANILHEPGTPGLRERYNAAASRIKKTITRLRAPLRQTRKSIKVRRGRPTCNTSKEEFSKMVRRAKRYIKEGDIFQVVLSRRWRAKSNEPPLEVYRRLRRINPSPYMFLLCSGNRAIVGSSPEMLVRVERGTVETRPIAGTRPRGKDAAEDKRLSDDLLSDPKELAEHTMLLDLGRNDVGRVSQAGTVEVRDKMIIEKYSHVIHIVSSVIGQLDKKHTPLDAHFACFPAGTVSGAPKIRAMEIIDELEKSRRGIYAGSIAYLDFWGNLDSCIAIRTVVSDGDSYYVQAGAGIVADSRPAREYEETAEKARALMEAVMGKAVL